MQILTIAHILLALPNVHVDELRPLHTVGQGEGEVNERTPTPCQGSQSHCMNHLPPPPPTFLT